MTAYPVSTLFPYTTLFRSFFSGNFAARRNLYVHHDSVSARWNGKRGVFHVRSFLAKNRAEQAFLRCQFGLALRRNLANENVTRRSEERRVGKDRTTAE